MSRFAQMCLLGILSGIVVFIIGAKVERPLAPLTAYFMFNLWQVGANIAAAVAESRHSHQPPTK